MSKESVLVRISFFVILYLFIEYAPAYINPFGSLRALGTRERIEDINVSDCLFTITYAVLR